MRTHRLLSTVSGPCCNVQCGQADVEKLSYNGEEAVPQLIGTLTEGAVLGDVPWLNRTCKASELREDWLGLFVICWGIVQP